MTAGQIRTWVVMDAWPVYGTECVRSWATDPLPSRKLSKNSDLEEKSEVNHAVVERCSRIKNQVAATVR